MMGIVFQHSKYQARAADGVADMDRVLGLRQQSFQNAQNIARLDDYDKACQHILVERVQDGALVCAFRFMHINQPAGLDRCYSAQFYDLSAVKDYPCDYLELGRFCIDQSVIDPDVLRVAWAVITRFVDREGIKLLFGCSSFEGTDIVPYRDAFAKLGQDHLAPPAFAPRRRYNEVYDFAKVLQGVVPEARHAQRTMPPLLRTYLGMGGWVSDHAVIDRVMDTLHVFTGVEIAKIPPARKKLLRADAI